MKSHAVLDDVFSICLLDAVGCSVRFLNFLVYAEENERVWLTIFKELHQQQHKVFGR